MLTVARPGGAVAAAALGVGGGRAGPRRRRRRALGPPAPRRAAARRRRRRHLHPPDRLRRGARPSRACRRTATSSSTPRPIGRQPRHLPAARSAAASRQPDGGLAGRRHPARLLARRPADRLPLRARRRRPLPHGRDGRVRRPPADRLRLQPGLVAATAGSSALCHRGGRRPGRAALQQRALAGRPRDAAQAAGGVGGRRRAAELVARRPAHRLLGAAGGQRPAGDLDRCRRRRGPGAR